MGKYTFIDLFAGIGGFRKAFDAVGCQCVFSSELDKFARETYVANYGEMPHGDITQIDNAGIPEFDILLAGFPCQAFSHAGLKQGFQDKRGSMFFEIQRIIAAKQPKAFLFENVKHLKGHDKGRTFGTILNCLENDLGYKVSYRVINSCNFVPQNRERLFISGFKKDICFDLNNLILPKSIPKLDCILFNGEIDSKYTLSDRAWSGFKLRAYKNKEKGKGFKHSVFNGRDVSRTLTARYWKDGSEILIAQENKNPRRLTPRECSRLMGFDSFQGKDFIIPVSDTQAYKQFGNAVVVPLVKFIADKMVNAL